MIKNIFKTESVIRVGPNDRLSHIMSLLSSSHDAAFVFDGEQFLGIINPYHAVIQKSFPSNTKAKHCLVHPPRVDINLALKNVVLLMINSRIHYLPVFEKNKFQAIISARRILSNIISSPELKIKISEYLAEKKPLISIFENDYVSKALTLFKDKKVSKLIVLSADLKLRGILTNYDLVTHLFKPMESQHFGSREGDKSPFLKTKVKNFMKTKLLTLRQTNSLKDAARLILQNEIGSIIIVDRIGSPVGIITTQDLLRAYTGSNPAWKVNFVGKRLSSKSSSIVGEFLTKLNIKFSKRSDVESAKVIVSEKRGAGVYTAAVSLFSKGGLSKIVKMQGKNLNKILKEITDKIRRRE